MNRDELEYGPVFVEGWFEADRIGYYDNDEMDDDGRDCAIVYFGNMFLALDIGYFMIPHESLRPVTTDDLWKRKEAIGFEIGGRLLRLPKHERPSFEERYKLLLELAYIEDVLMDRLFLARFGVKGKARVGVFISYSSNDKQFAKWLAVDLANAGHRPWLDEWNIRAGDSIPQEIGLGIEACKFVLVILSKSSVASHWVEREWQAKYWKEVQENQVMVIPLLIESCEIPLLLQPKKYADFRDEYSDGMETVLAALLPRKRQLTSRSTRTRRKRRTG